MSRETCKNHGSTFNYDQGCPACAKMSTEKPLTGAEIDDLLDYYKELGRALPVEDVERLCAQAKEANALKEALGYAAILLDLDKHHFDGEVGGCHECFIKSLLQEPQ